MARQTETPQDAIDQLWTQMARVRTSMLWTRDSLQHPQPMTQFPNAESGLVWFITASDTDLAMDVRLGADSMLTFVSGAQDYHASVAGYLEISDDEDKLDELWSVAAAAWFEHGREDPKVTLLKFTPREASVWASSSNPVLTGLKLLRAGLQEGESEPEVGVHHVLQLNAA